MSELNREEIIKALECCHNNSEMDCRDCPYWNKVIDLYYGCVNTLVKDAIALIKELTEENERLNERLGREARCQYDLCGQIVNLRDDVKYIKADTVQKMQERLKYSLCCVPQCHFNYAEVEFHIDRIAKEMLEE